jgi:hypothetical protein
LIKSQIFDSKLLENVTSGVYLTPPLKNTGYKHKPVNTKGNPIQKLNMH